jgi:hypothetical protein
MKASPKGALFAPGVFGTLSRSFFSMDDIEANHEIVRGWQWTPRHAELHKGGVVLVELSE